VSRLLVGGMVAFAVIVMWFINFDSDRVFLVQVVCAHLLCTSRKGRSDWLVAGHTHFDQLRHFCACLTAECGHFNIRLNILSLLYTVSFTLPVFVSP
jgi:hypothetical protein